MGPTRGFRDFRVSKAARGGAYEIFGDFSVGGVKKNA